MKMPPPRLRLASLIFPLEIFKPLMATVTLPSVPIAKMRNSGVAGAVERCTVSVPAPLPLIVMSDIRSGRALLRLIVQTPPVQPATPLPFSRSVTTALDSADDLSDQANRSSDAALRVIENHTKRPASTAMISGADRRGEGCAVTAAEYATAILYNGLGEYELAFEAAHKAATADEIATSSWALCELVEAAARSGRQAIARESLGQLRERTGASGTAWAKGTEARASALLEDGGSAEDLHREGIEALGQTRLAAHLARARLSYGEWLRRENRRVDAREQLRQAYDAFATMGADGFADRARRELVATGEKMRKRRDDTRDELTPQEAQIARLARDGHTNPEIGAELYISPRTVEWHLRKIYSKLGVSSRKGLRRALRSPIRATTPA